MISHRRSRNRSTNIGPILHMNGNSYIWKPVMASHSLPAWPHFLGTSSCQELDKLKTVG